MEQQAALQRTIALEIAPECAETETAERLRKRFGQVQGENVPLTLRLDGEGLCLLSGEQALRGGFSRMLSRISPGRLQGELLVKAARIRGAEGPWTAIDATAGLGEDSFLLAAAGFHVTLYERNPVVYELLRDALDRAAVVPELTEIVGRMELREEDSVAAMAHLTAAPAVILLDPMFPERQKTALVKKKLQIIQKLEAPCADERELLLTAMKAGPKKLLVKRPPKGPYLAGIKPDHSITGKAVRFDCFVSPGERLHKFDL